MNSSIISEELPSLRSYAHLLVGEVAAGDEIVSAMLRDFVFDAQTSELPDISRECLFQTLDAKLLDRLQLDCAEVETVPELQGLSLHERRCLLLTVIGRFDPFQVASITGVSLESVEGLLSRMTPAVVTVEATGVLIIEDDPYMAELLGILVEQAGHRVAGIAHSLAEAVKLARSQEFGLILSDVELNQKQSGPDAVRSIQAEVGRQVPAVYITAHPDRVSSDEVELEGGLISKPFDIWRVRDVIAEALRRLPTIQTGM